MISLRTSTGLKEVGEIYLRTPSGLKGVGEIWLRTTSGLKQVFGQFSISAAPTSVTGSTASHSPTRIATGTVSVTPNTDGAVDSVSWSFADTGWDAINPTSLNTAFRSPPVPAGGTDSTTATCTVTRGGATANTTVSANVYNYGS